MRADRTANRGVSLVVRGGYRCGYGSGSRCSRHLVGVAGSPAPVKVQVSDVVRLVVTVLVRLLTTLAR
jgi:hypothetical protein